MRAVGPPWYGWRPPPGPRAARRAGRRVHAAARRRGRPEGEPARAPTAWIGRDERRGIVASSLGTVIEWYDFYLYGSLAGIIAKQFFSSLDATAQFIFALLAFAPGFAVRPFGALMTAVVGALLVPETKDRDVRHDASA